MIQHFTGLLLEKRDAALVLYSSFDKMYSSKFCGCKAVDYYLQLPGKVCVVVKSVDLDSVLVGCDQIFRRLLQQGKARQGSSGSSSETSESVQAEPQRLELCFVVSTEGDGDGDAALRQRITARLDRILAEGDAPSVSIWRILIASRQGSCMTESAFVVTGQGGPAAARHRGAVPGPTRFFRGRGRGGGGSGESDARRVRRAPGGYCGGQAVRGVEQPTPGPRAAPEPGKSTQGRRPMHVSDLVHTYTAQAQQESLYRIEVAYTAALIQADRVLAQWQKRVSGGKQVSGRRSSLSAGADVTA